MKQNLECVVINSTNKKHNAVVIWLHGLGADGYDFASIVHQLNFPQDLRVKFIFPHAPMRSITINPGCKMRGWFDISDLENIDANEDIAGVKESQQEILKLIHEEEKNIPSNKIVLAGFSQGGVIVLYAGLSHEKPLAGILALSTYLSTKNNIAEYTNPANKDIQIMIAHGIHDSIIPISLAKKSRDILIKNNYQVTWCEYPMQHNVCNQEIKDINAWLINVLTPNNQCAF